MYKGKPPSNAENMIKIIRDGNGVGSNAADEYGAFSTDVERDENI
jgi:hypothetical protein